MPRRAAPGAATLGCMSTTVKAADAAQFLSVVPRLLGYTPTRSVVLVPMARGRSLGALRVDLPPGDDRETLDRLASSLLGMVCRISGADGIVAVQYTDAEASPVLPGEDLTESLRSCADACGVALVDSLTVAADGWGSHLDPDCPAQGRSLALLQRRLPAGLPAVRGDQLSGARLPRTPAGAKKDVARALDSLRDALEVICGIPSGSPRGERIDPAALEAACRLDDLPELFEQALTWDGEHIAAMDAAVVAWCLARPALRDVALVQWASDIAGGDDAFDAQRRWEDGEDYPADLASVMWGEGDSPDPDRIEKALELARHVTARLARAARPGPLAVCAWLSWALGRSTHADRYACLALEIEPDHGLADIVRSFVTAGHLPDWAFRRS